MPGIELMERAGAGLTELVMARAPAGRIVVVCGKGNNGGDGLVVARLLRDRGRDVDVLLLAPGEELRGDARANFERLPGRPAEPFHPGRLTGAAAIVDAILGTGFSGEPREPAKGAIEAINRRCRSRRRRTGPPGGDRLRRPQRRRRLHRRGRRGGRPRRCHRHLPRRQAGPVDLARQGPRRRGDGDRHRHPARRARPSVGGADRQRRRRRDPQPGARVDQVRRRRGARVRGLHRPHRRSLPGQRGGAAGRCRLCHGAGAGVAGLRVRAAAAGGDVGSAARRRRRVAAVGGGHRPGADRAGRSTGARPGSGSGAGDLRAGANRGRARGDPAAAGCRRPQRPRRTARGPWPAGRRRR